MDNITHADKNKTPAPIFYGICLSTKPGDLPFSFYRSEWLVSKNYQHPVNAPLNSLSTPKNPILDGVVYYFLVSDADCIAVPKQDVRNDSEGIQNEAQLDWVSAESVPKSLIQVGARLARVYYGVCIESNHDNFPRVIFYRSKWLGPDDPTPKKSNLDGAAYYFQEDGASFSSVIERDVQNDGAGGHNRIRLDWVHMPSRGS
jgi:hypothetical protein